MINSSGMNDRGILYSNITFSGYAHIHDKKRKMSEGIDGVDCEYWVLKDQYGLSLLCFEKKLADSLVLFERYRISGEVKVGKGSVFLVLKDANAFNGNDFQEKK